MYVRINESWNDELTAFKDDDLDSKYMILDWCLC